MRHARVRFINLVLISQASAISGVNPIHSNSATPAMTGTTAAPAILVAIWDAAVAARHEQDRHRSHADGEGQDDHDGALGVGGVDQRPERGGSDHPGIAADGHDQADTRACLQLSRIIAAANWTPARKFLASLS
jgi:zinc transporter ZupT